MKTAKVKKKKSLARRIIEWVLLVVFGGAFIVVMAGQIDGMIHREENFNQTLRFGWGSFVVLTNSMEPVYPVNSAVVTYKKDAEDIYNEYLKFNILEEDLAGKEITHPIDITFQNYRLDFRVEPTNPRYKSPVYEQAVITHRLVEVQVDMSIPKGEGRYVFITRGINTQGQLSLESQYQYFTEKQILGVVTFGSSALGWLFQALSSPWGLLIFLLVPAFYLVIVSVKDIFKAVKDEPEGPTDPGAGGPPSVGGSEDALAGLSEEDKKRLKEELLQQMIDEKTKGK